jgi:hypothetical protein
VYITGLASLEGTSTADAAFSAEQEAGIHTSLIACGVALRNIIALVRLLKEAYGAGGLDPEVVSAAQRRFRAQFEAELRRQWEQERVAAEIAAADAARAAAEAAVVEAAALRAAAMETAEAVALAAAVAAEVAAEAPVSTALMCEEATEVKVESAMDSQSQENDHAGDDLSAAAPLEVPVKLEHPRVSVCTSEEEEAATELDTQSLSNTEEWVDDARSDGEDDLSDVDEPALSDAGDADDAGSVSDAASLPGRMLRAPALWTEDTVPAVLQVRIPHVHDPTQHSEVRLEYNRMHANLWLYTTDGNSALLARRLQSFLDLPDVRKALDGISSAFAVVAFTAPSADGAQLKTVFRQDQLILLLNFSGEGWEAQAMRAALRGELHEISVADVVMSE